jgi:hypothetical protein
MRLYRTRHRFPDLYTRELRTQISVIFTDGILELLRDAPDLFTMNGSILSLCQAMDGISSTIITATEAYT